MKGCLRFNSGREHELSITQYNMETVVIESLFVKDRSEAILLKMSSTRDHFPSLPNGEKSTFAGPLCNSRAEDFNFTAFFLQSCCILLAALKVRGVNGPSRPRVVLCCVHFSSGYSTFPLHGAWPRLRLCLSTEHSANPLRPPNEQFKMLACV